MDGICIRMLEQLTSFSCNWSYCLFYSFLSGVEQLTLSWILQVAALHLLKTCLVGWRVFRLNPGNGSIMTFTNDTRHRVRSLKAVFLGMEVIWIKSPSIYHAYIMILSLTLSPLAKQPATHGSNCLEIFNVYKAPFCIKKIHSWIMFNRWTEVQVIFPVMSILLSL